jgi:hypothetical protein
MPFNNNHAVCMKRETQTVSGAPYTDGINRTASSFSTTIQNTSTNNGSSIRGRLSSSRMSYQSFFLMCESAGEHVNTIGDIR